MRVNVPFEVIFTHIKSRKNIFKMHSWCVKKITCVLKTVIAHNMDTCKTCYTDTFLHLFFYFLEFLVNSNTLKIHWHTREGTVNSEV